MSRRAVNSTKACPMCKNFHNYQPSQAVQIQAKTPQRLASLVQRMTRGQLKKRPQPGKWSVAEILHHLNDCEIVYGFRTRLILAEQKPRLTPFDQNAWAANLGYATSDPGLALQSFVSVRRQNVAIMRRLTPEDWDRVGDHVEYGPITFRQVIYHLTDHDQNHLAQIARLRERLLSKRPRGEGRAGMGPARTGSRLRGG